MKFQSLNIQLSIKLLNQAQEHGLIGTVKNLMQDFRKETGGFKGFKLLNQSAVNPHVDRQEYALSYEYCTLRLQLFHNRLTNQQSLGGFNIL